MGSRSRSFTGWEFGRHKIEGLGKYDGAILLRIPPGYEMSAIGIATETERLFGYESADEKQLQAFAERHARCFRGLTRIYGFGGTCFVPGGKPAEIDVPYLRVRMGARGPRAKVVTHRLDGNKRMFNGIAGANVGFLILEPMGSLADLACHGRPS